MKQALAPFFVLAAAAALVAQEPTVVDAAGTAFPVSTLAFPIDPPILFTVPTAVTNTGNVYVSLPSSWPTGYYLLDVRDPNFVDLAQLPAEDRVFYAVNNGAGGFSISRVSSTPNLPALGEGLNGVGDSIPVFPFTSPVPFPGRPDLNCAQKALLWSLGASPTGTPVFLGSHYFRIGDGSPGTVSGVVFEDLNQNGVRDVGEAGVGGCPVKLVSNNPSNPGLVVATTSTASNGSYSFGGVAIDDCSVVLDLNTQLYQATTPTDVRLSNCGCGTQTVDFGKFTIHLACVGRTPGFWRNRNGVAIIQNGGYWDELAALNLVNGCGYAFNPSGNVCQWRFYMAGANAWNMAYMLSVHLAAMQLNVLSGGVNPNCWVQTSQGPMTIAALMSAANIALAQDPYTPPCDPNRIVQQFLKNALDAANNNLNWL